MSRKLDRQVEALAKEAAKSNWYKQMEENESAETSVSSRQVDNSINSGLGILFLFLGFFIAMIGLGILGTHYGEAITGTLKWIQTGSYVVGGILCILGIILLMQVGTLIMVLGVIFIPLGVFLFYKGIIIDSWKVFAIYMGLDLLSILLGAIMRE